MKQGIQVAFETIEMTLVMSFYGDTDVHDVHVHTHIKL